MKKTLIGAATWMATCLLSGPATAEVVQGTNLSVDFHAGHVVGAGRNINMLRVPVTDIVTGHTTYYDASFRFSFDPVDGFIFEQFSSVALSAPAATDNIRAGRYVDSSNWCYRIEGPSMMPGGRSLFSIRAGGEGCSNNVGFSASIVTGTAAGHPDIGSRDIVPHLNDSWTYGIVSVKGGSSGFGGSWPVNGLIGVRQNGEQIVFALFNLNGGDTFEPQQSSVLARVGD